MGSYLARCVDYTSPLPDQKRKEHIFSTHLITQITKSDKDVTTELPMFVINTDAKMLSKVQCIREKIFPYRCESLLPGYRNQAMLC